MIYYLHGAFSTSRAWNWLTLQLPEHEKCCIEYKTKWSLSQNVQQIEQALTSKPTAFVGHSLGGLLAAVLVAKGHCQKGVAIAAPLCGFYFGPAAGLDVLDVLTHEYGEEFLSVVTTKDRVVHPKMQRLARGAKIYETQVNHFEAVLDPGVAQAVSEHLFGG